MSDQVREIKEKADIVSIIGERLKLKKAGRNFRALCPFHSEKTPSFNVSPELQMYKCFGCGASGDVFSFLEAFEGMTFPEALRFVADRVGVKLIRFEPTDEQKRRERLLAILDLAAEYYYFLLTDHTVGDEARRYLKGRGVWQETIKTFQLGFAPDSWEGVQTYLVSKKGYRVEDLEAAGLVIPRSKEGTEGTHSTSSGQAGGRGHYDRFRNRVIFPQKNQRGQVVGFAGRVLGTNAASAEASASQAKYINSPETELYHKSEILYGLSVAKSAIKKADQAVVVEGELDVLSSWQAGVKNVVAIKGSALTEEQIRLLARYSKNILLSLDSDSAGDEATKRGIALADKAGMNVRVVALEGGKDPDEIARSGAGKWQTLVKEPVSVYDFYLSSTLKRFDAKTGEGKRLISRELIPIWAGITNQIEQAHYIKKLARVLDADEEVVVREVERVSQGMGKKEEAPETAVREGPLNLEEYVLGLVLKSREKVLERAGNVQSTLFQSRAVARVIEVLQQPQAKAFLVEGRWDISAFTQSLPGELKDIVERVWLVEFQSDDHPWLERELERGVRALKRLQVRRSLEEFSAKIATLEHKKPLSAKEKAELKKFQEQFVEASKSLKTLV